MGMSLVLHFECGIFGCCVSVFQVSASFSEIAFRQPSYLASQICTFTWSRKTFWFCLWILNCSILGAHFICLFFPHDSFSDLVILGCPLKFQNFRMKFQMPSSYTCEIYWLVAFPIGWVVGRPVNLGRVNRLLTSYVFFFFLWFGIWCFPFWWWW